MIQVSHLSKSFAGINAVDDLSFEIKKGEVVGLLGPNGAGKSTTMRMMTGFLMPDQGTVKIHSISVTDQPTEAQKRIGYLPENNPLYKDMLVGELLEFSADIKNISKAERSATFDFVVSSVNIGDVYYRNIQELSKGYKQRVGIAIALLHKPEILIMDEPTEGLDPNQRQEIRTLIKDLSKDHTIIVSTHVMQEVEAVCDRLLIISKGKLVADGKPKQLTRRGGNLTEVAIEIEGKDIVKHLHSLKLIQDLTQVKTKDMRVSAVLLTKLSPAIQPELSKLAQKHSWIIWRINEQQKHLEDVFQELTK